MADSFEVPAPHSCQWVVQVPRPEHGRGVVLFLVSEILPFTPLKGNGLIDQILKSAREIFPHKSDTDV